jgi:hypothetical protein
MRSTLVDEESLIMINVLDAFGAFKKLDWDLYYSLKCEDDLNEIYYLPNVSFGRLENGQMVIKEEEIENIDEVLEEAGKQLESVVLKPWDPTLNLMH